MSRRAEDTYKEYCTTWRYYDAAIWQVFAVQLAAASLFAAALRIGSADETPTPIEGAHLQRSGNGQLQGWLIIGLCVMSLTYSYVLIKHRDNQDRVSRLLGFLERKYVRDGVGGPNYAWARPPGLFQGWDRRPSRRFGVRGFIEKSIPSLCSGSAFYLAAMGYLALITAALMYAIRLILGDSAWHLPLAIAVLGYSLASAALNFTDPPDIKEESCLRLDICGTPSDIPWQGDASETGCVVAAPIHIDSEPLPKTVSSVCSIDRTKRNKDSPPGVVVNIEGVYDKDMSHAASLIAEEMGISAEALKANPTLCVTRPDIGAGLGGSSSILVAITRSMMRYFGFGEANAMDVAAASRFGEAHGLGNYGGWQDHVIAANNRSGIIKTTASSVTFEPLPILRATLSETAIYVVSGVQRHSKSGDILKDVTKRSSTLRAMSNSASLMISQLLEASSSSERLTVIANAMTAQQSFYRQNGLSTVVVDAIVNWALSTKIVYGAKLCGAGGGGAICILVDPDKVAEWDEEWRRANWKYKSSLRLHRVRIVG